MSRARVGIIAIVVVVIEAVIIGVLSMLRTKYIIESFGTDINAILQLAISLTSYLLLFESGMGVAFQYKMYKPIAMGKFDKVGELFNGLKLNMKKVAFKMLSIAIIISLIYSIFLKNKGVTYIDASTILIIMFIRIIAPNVISLHYRTVLFAMEKKYISDMVECIKNSLTIILEIILILNTDLPLVFILSIYIFSTYISSLIYKSIIYKLNGREIIKAKEYDMEPISMTNDILVHRIAGLITSNTDSVLLSIFTSLNNVTIYTSFYTLINYPITLIMRIIDTMRASLAVKISKDDKNSLDIFNVMLVFEIFSICNILPVFILMANECIALWIGPNYQTTVINLILISGIGMHKMFIPVIYAARDAKGLFKETKRFSLLQAVINLLISLILVKPLGITGILLGTLISDYLILQPFNIKVVSDKVFNCKSQVYKMIYQSLLLCTISIIIGNLILNMKFIDSLIGWSGFFIKSVLVISINFVVVISILYLIQPSFRSLITLVKNAFKLKERT